MTIYCFLEVSVGFAAIPGKIIIELFDKQVPKSAENFRALCTGERGFGFQYQGTQFHRVVEAFTLQGGDTSGEASNGGCSIYADGEAAFTGEDLYWRDIDSEMLVCMADGIPRSQFFITLRPCPSLNGQHTCVGRVIRGQQIIEQLGDVKVDEEDHPFEPITIARAGELEYKGPTATQSARVVGKEEKIGVEALEDGEETQHDKEGTPREDRKAIVDEKRSETVRHRSRRSRSPKESSHRHSHRRRDREDRGYKSYGSDDRVRRGSTSRRYESSERERIDREERIRENARYRRDPDHKPEVEYKGRGKMVYRSHANGSSSYGRLN